MSSSVPRHNARLNWNTCGGSIDLLPASSVVTITLTSSLSVHARFFSVRRAMDVNFAVGTLFQRTPMPDVSTKSSLSVPASLEICRN